MKTIGLIGGMSWESTVTYYQVINTCVKEKLGGLHSAKCLLYSVDFAQIEECQKNNEWEKSGQILSDAAKALEKAGADFILICTNTMHKVYPQIQKNISVPLLHIAEVTAQMLKKEAITKVALLGTKYTMQETFYAGIIEENGIKVITPSEKEQDYINSVIFDELCKGIIRNESKEKLLQIIDELSKQGAQGVILGCTEIGLLIKQEDTKVPLFDTTIIHAEAAVQEALS